MENQKFFSIKMGEDTIRKLKHIAKYEHRSAKGQITNLINECIREFEKEYGEIDVEQIMKEKRDKEA